MADSRSVCASAQTMTGDSTTEPNRFDGLSLRGWRQFDQVDITFHHRLTVLTGANGSGKTTILNILNRHFGWDLAFVSTFTRTEQLRRYFADYWSGEAPPQPNVPGDHVAIGGIRYTQGPPATLSVPTKVEQEYQVRINDGQTVPGLFVSSHRAFFRYQAVATIPVKLEPEEELFKRYAAEMRQRYVVNARVPSPSLRIKEVLISLAVFGYGNQAVRPYPEAAQLFEGFQEILRQLMPPQLGFRGIAIEPPEVLLDTASGTFSLDAASGGVSAIVDLAWQIYMYSQTHPKHAVVIDEPENHLHPELQQALFPNLLRAFPGCQFIVATHNPFIVGAVPDSNVYVLRFDEDRRVGSTLLDTANKAGTSNEILREVLGLKFTMPLWVNSRLQELVRQYSGKSLGQEELAALVADLTSLGLDDALPDVLRRLREDQT